MCVCLCVCVERETDRESEGENKELAHTILEADKSKNLQSAH